MPRGAGYWLVKSEPDTFSIDDLASDSKKDDLLGWCSQLSGPQPDAG